MQRVKCFSETKFIDSDTCPRDKELLTKMTDACSRTAKAVKKSYDNYGVSWYTWTEDLKAPNTACHAALTGLNKHTKFLLDAICWRGGAYRTDGPGEGPLTAPPFEFSKKFLDWAHSPDSIWSEVLDRCVVLEGEEGEVLARLFLNPAKTPMAPMNHFLITSGRFITEWPNMSATATKLYAAYPNMRAALWYGHNFTQDGVRRPVLGGHKGFTGLSGKVPKAFFGDKTGIDQTPLANKTSAIFVNSQYMENTRKFPECKTMDEFIEAWKTIEGPPKPKVLGKKPVTRKKVTK